MSSFMTGAFQIIQGVESLKATKTESKAQKGQAGIALSESEQEADRLKASNEEFEQRQRLAFLKSGVRLEGTPLQVLAETEKVGAREEESVRQAGVARAGLFFSKSRITERSGRAAFLGSLAGASQSFVKGSKEGPLNRSTT